MSRISALINPLSGSVPADAASLLSEALAELGETASITNLGESDFSASIDEAVRSSPDLIIVWSGDGTVAGALECAGDEGPPILPLPGGTMNLFHKQIHRGLCDWKTCLERALKDGRMIDVPAGLAGRRRFYVAAMTGGLTDLAAPREALRKGRVLEAVETLAGSDALDLRTDMKFDLADVDGKPVSGHATASAMFVGDIGKEALEFAYIDPDNPIELAAAGVGALVADWRQAAGVTSVHAREITLSHEKGHDLRATLDGEPVRLASGTRFSRIAKAGRAISAMME